MNLGQEFTEDRIEITLSGESSIYGRIRPEAILRVRTLDACWTIPDPDGVTLYQEVTAAENLTYGPNGRRGPIQPGEEYRPEATNMIGGTGAYATTWPEDAWELAQPAAERLLAKVRAEWAERVAWGGTDPTVRPPLTRPGEAERFAEIAGTTPAAFWERSVRYYGPDEVSPGMVCGEWWDGKEEQRRFSGEPMPTDRRAWRWLCGRLMHEQQRAAKATAS